MVIVEPNTCQSTVWMDKATFPNSDLTNQNAPDQCNVASAHIPTWCVNAPVDRRLKDFDGPLRRLSISTLLPSKSNSDRMQKGFGNTSSWHWKFPFGNLLKRQSSIDCDSTIAASPLEALQRQSLQDELQMIHTSKDRPVVSFPIYFTDHDRKLVHQIASKLNLRVRIASDKSLHVFKPVRVLSRKKYPNTDGYNNVAVNVPELASRGHDHFIHHLQLKRLDSAGGNRSQLLWELANNNNDARPVESGLGGVYAMQSKEGNRQVVAMFKPIEEERFVREGLRAGEGAVREEAAYVLDATTGHFCDVPPTAVAKLQVPGSKVQQGAVQRYMESAKGSLEDFVMPESLEMAQAQVPIHEVHKIGVLDIRLFNTDRHLGNILMVGESAPYKLIPIDHGCVLPSWDHLAEARMEWSLLPQANVPFTPQFQHYIKNLNVEEDAQKLRRLGIREECVTTMVISTTFLQIATAAGRTLAWMAKVLQRVGCLKHPSSFELMILEASLEISLPFRFETNQWGEETGNIPPGILSRRPPNAFFVILRSLMTLNCSSIFDEKIHNTHL